jgi:hypothetical protein
VRADKERLIVIIADDADAAAGMHEREILVELGPKMVVLDIMDGADEPVRPVNRHSAPLRAQMRVVIRAKKKIVDAINLRDNAKKTTHPFLLD